MLELTKARSITGFVDFRVRVPNKDAECIGTALQMFLAAIKKGAYCEEEKKGKDDEGKVEWDEVFPDAHPGVILRGAREMENLSQVALAKMINVHRGNISAMEVGVRKISVNMAKRLAEALNCNYKIFL
jgi:DNA-binding XRE family transcriptional regulator